MIKENEVAIVAGGAGFVGTHLSEELLDRGLKVIGVDNFVTGAKNNVEYLSKDPNYDFIEQDIAEELKYPDNVDYVFDLACPASPTDFENLNLEILMANTFGVYNLLKFAVEKNATFLFSSTSEVYGDPEVSPQSEDYRGNVSTTGIRSIYDEGKRHGEAMVMTFNRRYSLDSRIVRIFNTYGERMRADDGRAIPTFINQAINNEDITIFGDGTQTRSPQYVSDLVTGILKLTESEIITPVNIGNPVEMTMIELAGLIIQVVGSESKLNFSAPLPEDDPKRRLPDISLAQKELGWNPKVSPEVGLKKTAEWFRTNK